MKPSELIYLQRSDRIAVGFVVMLIIFILSGIIWLGREETTTGGGYESRLLERKKKSTYKEDYIWTKERKKRLFPFDPNTADSTDLQLLGLASYQIRNIYRYRAKGGIFRSPESFARLYGLTRKQYRELKPYITIGDDYLPASTLASVEAWHEQRVAERQKAHDAYEQYKAQDNYRPYKKYDRDTIRYPIKIKVGEHINLATADTTQLKKVPGIGSGWAHAIISYGQRLGGYVSVGQLKEIENFPVESLPYFVVSNPKTTKMNLNQLSVSQLRRHPYINFYQARAIFDFRNQRGKLNDLSQLHLLKEFPPEAIERLRPYVCY